MDQLDMFPLTEPHPPVPISRRTRWYRKAQKETRQVSKRRYQPWTAKDMELLRTMIAAKKGDGSQLFTQRQIALALNRPLTAVWNKLKRLRGTYRR